MCFTLYGETASKNRREPLFEIHHKMAESSICAFFLTPSSTCPLPQVMFKNIGLKVLLQYGRITMSES